MKRERFDDIHTSISKEEKKKHINWCSKHQERHCEYPMYKSCRFPNRKNEILKIDFNRRSVGTLWDNNE
ncbi:hypothetical protein LCGC14_2916360 [marine sediment metagenome]|uniref:Uncharacterized protein n=1 Tax=marine sediment metagenome TaxID=412755 RepID=A0A0F8ZXP2_9ZZZZ